MLPIRNISYLSPMYCSFWEKCKNSSKTGLGCSTPLIGANLIKDGNSSFFLQLSNVWRWMLLLIYRLNFPLQLILIIPGVKLLILWLFHFGKIILGKERFITGQASYGTIYQMIYVIIINQWACFLLKNFWLLYNESYCVSYVNFIYLNFIAFPKG